MSHPHRVEIEDLHGSLNAGDQKVQDSAGARRSKIWLNGYLVPYLTADVVNPSVIRLFIDERFSMIVGTGGLNDMVWFLANAMAVAAGYTSFGNESKPVNLFQRSALYYELSEDLG